MIQRIITVSSDSFASGTEVLFRSIRKHNPWFQGEFIVIDAGLCDLRKSALKEEFNCLFVQPSSSLEVAVDKLVHTFKGFENSKNRFYSLEFFNASPEGQNLFLDSDILCCANFSELNRITELFSAVPDPRYFEGHVRNKFSLLPKPKTAIDPQFMSFFIERFFNTGMMLTCGMGSSVYKDLIEMLAPSTYEKVKTGHTDTVVLNQLLLDKVNWLDLKFNTYQSIAHLSEITPTFIHYLGRSKPWMKNLEEMTNFELEWLNIYRDGEE